jgi:cardiolipin synthase
VDKEWKMMNYFRVTLTIISFGLLANTNPNLSEGDAGGRISYVGFETPAIMTEKNDETLAAGAYLDFTLGSFFGGKTAQQNVGEFTTDGISLAATVPAHTVEPGNYAASLSFNRHPSDLIPTPNRAKYTEEGTSLGFFFRLLDAVVFHSHVVTIIKNPISSSYRLVNYAVDTTKGTLTSTVHEYNGPIPPVSNVQPMDLEMWEQKLNKITSGNRYKGRVKFLIDGENFFPTLIQSIQDAKESINIRINIFDTDDFAVKIADLLKERSEEVKVKVLMDEMSSLLNGRSPPKSSVPENFTFPASIEEYMEKDSKVRIRSTANPWFTSDHTKTITIDKRKAYIGGMNIGREYRYDWHDMMVELEGPIVGRLNKDFYKAWAHEGLTGDLGYAWASLFRTEKYKGQKQRDEYIDIRPLYTKTGDEEIYRAQIAAIQEARSYIYMENPYFTDDTTLNELIKARRRGVDVRVILPAYTDSGLFNDSNLLVANSMIRNGIRVYIFPGMTHVKAAIYDGWACLGSANFNLLSMRLNQETNIGISDPEIVNQLKYELFEVDFEKSSEMKELREVDLTHYISEAILDMF